MHLSTKSRRKSLVALVMGGRARRSRQGTRRRVMGDQRAQCLGLDAHARCHCARGRSLDLGQSTMRQNMLLLSSWKSFLRHGVGPECCGGPKHMQLCAHRRPPLRRQLSAHHQPFSCTCLSCPHSRVRPSCALFPQQALFQPLTVFFCLGSHHDEIGMDPAAVRVHRRTWNFGYDAAHAKHRCYGRHSHGSVRASVHARA